VPLTMLREPRADLESESGLADRNPPSTTTSEPRHEQGFVRGKIRNGVCYFAWIAWALHQGLARTVGRSCGSSK
jgi:hypothetical protein